MYSFASFWEKNWMIQTSPSGNGYLLVPKNFAKDGKKAQ